MSDQTTVGVPGQSRSCHGLTEVAVYDCFF